MSVLLPWPKSPCWLETDNIVLLKELLRRGHDADARDNHGWTVSQITAAFEPTISSNPDTQHSSPSSWSTAHKGEGLDIPDDDPLSVRYDSSDGDARSARSDHPIPLNKKFYFEVDIHKPGNGLVGIGFGRQDCPTKTMLGWRQNTWAYHGDDGGIFHADGWSLRENGDWKYGKGDCVGCCIDPIQRKAFFTNNGKPLGICFTNIYGRLFPMVGLGPGTHIVANFGRETFKYPDGLDRDYYDSEIEEISS